jgi:hypothetical protein
MTQMTQTCVCDRRAAAERPPGGGSRRAGEADLEFPIRPHCRSPRPATARDFVAPPVSDGNPRKDRCRMRINKHVLRVSAPSADDVICGHLRTALF